MNFKFDEIFSADTSLGEQLKSQEMSLLNGGASGQPSACREGGRCVSGGQGCASGGKCKNGGMNQDPGNAGPVNAW